MLLAYRYFLGSLLLRCTLPVELITWEGYNYIFDVVMLLLGEFWATFDNNFVAANTVVQFIMYKFIYMSVEEYFILLVIILCTDAYCDSFVSETVSYNSPKKFMS